MPTRAAKGHNGQVTWTRELKICVHLLYTEFDLRNREKAEVFNIVFERYLTGCGLPNGVSANIIHAQYGERKKPSNRDWASICHPPIDNTDIECRDGLRARIKATLSRRESRCITNAKTSTKKDEPSGTSSPRGAPTPAVTEKSPKRSSKFRKTVARAAYSPPRTPDRPTRASAVVVLPAAATGIKTRKPPTPPSTKTSTPKLGYKRNDGTTILVSPRAFKTIETRVRPVPEWKAQPPLPGLLFR